MVMVDVFKFLIIGLTWDLLSYLLFHPLTDGHSHLLFRLGYIWISLSSGSQKCLEIHILYNDVLSA